MVSAVESQVRENKKSGERNSDRKNTAFENLYKSEEKHRNFDLSVDVMIFKKKSQKGYDDICRQIFNLVTASMFTVSYINQL